MEIIWKVYWISWFLLLSSKYSSVDGNEATTLNSKASEKTTSTSTTTTTTTTTTTERNVEDQDKLKGQGDLDLETQDQVAILKQINRVNDDGSYTFGYEAADGSFKIETRDVNGNVKGMFGFINEDGELKRVSYSASNGTGFQSTGTLNIPPLPGTTLSSDDERSPGFSNGNSIRLKPKLVGDSSTKVNLIDVTTPVYEVPSETTPRLPVYIYGSSTPTSTSSARPVVIQHIPKVRPTPASSSTIPTESEEILLKPLLSDLAPKRTSNTNFISFGSNDVEKPVSEPTATEENSSNPSVIQVIRPRAGPFKKVIVTKRPVVTTTPKVVTTTEYKSKEYLEKLKHKGSKTEVGHGVRRQLGVNSNYVTTTTANLVTSGTEDSPDVYGGRHVSRPYPTSAYRALFNQVPQHQRILQNSYIQNRNQYLSAAVNNPGIPTTATPAQIIPSTSPGQVRTYTGPSTTQDPNITPVQSHYIPTPVPQSAPDLQNVSPNPIPIVPNYIRQYPQTTQQVVPALPTEPLPNPIYLPPGLLEHLIRMLLAAQQRLVSQRQQPISPFQQAVIATLGPGNVPPELLNSRYDPRYYQPQANYPYTDPMPSRAPYDPQYSVPYYQSYTPFDPRYAYQAQMFTPVPYPRYQPRVYPYEIDPARQQQNDDFVLRTLLGYSRYPPQTPFLTLQPTSNVVERSPTYQPPGKDSSSSSTTPSPKVQPVRNVEILGQIGEESQTSVRYETSTKAGP